MLRHCITQQGLVLALQFNHWSHKERLVTADKTCIPCRHFIPPFLHSISRSFDSYARKMLWLEIYRAIGSFVNELLSKQSNMVFMDLTVIHLQWEIRHTGLTCTLNWELTINSHSFASPVSSYPYSTLLSTYDLASYPNSMSLQFFTSFELHIFLLLLICVNQFRV